MLRSYWPCVGLVIVLAFLVHDVAMAADAHHAARSATATERTADQDVPTPHGASSPGDRHRPTHETPADGCHRVGCPPPGVCGVGRVAAHVPDREDPATGPPAWTVTDPLGGRFGLPPPAPRGANATLPPGVRRALLQVFRI
jgi:hypothetical protein